VSRKVIRTSLHPRRQLDAAADDKGSHRVREEPVEVMRDDNINDCTGHEAGETEE
jgi:hypothetical protein